MKTSVQLPLPLPHRASLRRDDFLVTDSNAAAVGWIDRWPDWPGPALCLYGPEGCGKSHLLSVWSARTGAGILEPDDPRLGEPDRLAAERAVAIDDAERLADEKSLFHLYNLLQQDGGHLLLASRLPPVRWPLKLPDLRSRLAAATAVAMEPPDDALLAAVVIKQFADRQVAVRTDVVQYLVRRMERSFATAGRLVDWLDRRSLSGKEPVTQKLVRAALEQDGSAVD